MENTTVGIVHFVNPEAQLLEPVLCSGNSCKVIGVRPNYRGDTGYISSFTIHNSGQKTVAISLTWGNPLGCGPTSNGVAFPGETIVIYSPGEPSYWTGYCGISANVQ